MAAAKKTPPTKPDSPATGTEKLIELQGIETLFDRRVRPKDTRHRYFWDGTWIRIVALSRSGVPQTHRLSPVGVIMGPEVGSAE